MSTLIKVTLDHERDTKRFHVYVDPTGQLIPPKIYVPKRGEEPAPAHVTLTVEE